MHHVGFITLIFYDALSTKHKGIDRMCVLISSQNFVRSISHLKKTERVIIKTVYWSSCKELLILVRFQ
jgi:hypothetical protein